jgi:signal transduction histidine kinase
LLDVSRLASGHLYLEPTDFDFSAMIGEVVEEFQLEVARAGIELTVTASGPIVGHWDRMRFAQVVSNLLSNAFRHGAGGPITLDLRASDDEVTLSVEDHGSGIDPALLPRIFERFERAPGERRRGGLGLGLYVAREIVEAHGGRIAVTSTPGAGSTFTISLPRRRPEPAPQDASPAAGAAPRGIDSGSP